MIDDKIKLGWKQLLALCQYMGKDAQLLDELFNLLLTFEEKEALATRVLLIHELLKGEMTQREIAQCLDISIAKITRGSNALKVTSPELKKILIEYAKIV